MDRKIALATLASLGVLLSACGGGGSSGGDTPAAPPPPSAPVEPPADTTPPTVPSGVTAVAQSQTEILVSWTASTDATGVAGYRVFRDGNTTAVATPTGTSFTDTGLTANTTYSYTVVAVDSAPAANVSAASVAASATTQAEPVTPPPPSGPVKIAVQRVFSGLTFTAAHSMMRVPHDTSRWVVVQQDGHVVAFADTPSVTTTSNVLDITDRVVFRNVHGLLGLAFHPNYPTDGRAWAAYTHETSPGVIVLRISEFSTADGGATLNPASEQIVFEMAQPGGHNNGGHLLFGRDGMLYAGPGDGGNDDSNSSQAGNGQLTNNLLGKILRLDVSGSTNGRRYKIPSDNPFAANALCNVDGTGTNDCPEIFAWGFRNPWRWTFDRANGDLWLGDVGSHSREEVNKVVKGGNYGWRCKEGTMDTTLMCGTPSVPLTPPVAEYAHPDGLAVTGGFVYHGTAIANLAGQYVFGDYSSGYLWHIPTNTAPTKLLTHADGWDSGLNPASFAEDTNGELFIVDVRNSGIYKLVQGQ
ncbi:MAG TPA: PQQ-dependent sugar dehydrogenase [Steroidobacteraceae bacterium]|nr:PQQ-dependent sugar dehydrogenase [Steroidobacteraceae bacterium]